MSTTDRKALAAFLKTLNTDDLIALKPDWSRGTQTDGHTDAAEVAEQRGITGDYDVIFWHQQSDDRAFDRMGQLVAPLMLHWGGDHDRLASLLAAIGQPYRVIDNGPDQAFAVTSTELDRWREQFPAPSDSSAVATRAKWLGNQEREDWTEADWRWLNEVVRDGNTSARARVANWLVRSPEHLDDDALDALVEDWVAVCKAAGDDAEPGWLLDVLHERGDERYDQVLTQCLKQRGWRFRWGAAGALGRHGDEQVIATLYSLATAKARKNDPIAANPPAITAWLGLRSRTEGRPVHELALAALGDDHFDASARDDLLEAAGHDLGQGPGRLIDGWLSLLEGPVSDPATRELLLAKVLGARWFDLAEPEHDETRSRHHARLLALLDAGGWADAAAARGRAERLVWGREQWDAYYERGDDD